MLLRAGLIYILSVMTVLLGGLAAWQHLDISLRDESAAVLSKRVTVLQNDLDALRRREEAAVRRALVAEDSLTRNETYNSSGAVRMNETRDQRANAQREEAASEEARIRIENDLAQAIKERDLIRVERDELQRVTDEARTAADKALQEADTARQEIVDLKKAAFTATHATVPQTSALSAEAVVVAPAAPQPELPAAQVTASKVKAAPDELVRPAAETAAVSTGDTTGDTKATLLPSAVTIEPAAKPEDPEKRTVKSLAAKRATVRSEPRQPAKSKPVTVGSSAAKKVPKQAKKDEPFFPF